MGNKKKMTQTHGAQEQVGEKKERPRYIRKTHKRRESKLNLGK